MDFVVQAEVLNPAFDSVPANLVDLLVTDSGSVTPAYVYRLLQVDSRPQWLVLCAAVLNHCNFAVSIILHRKTFQAKTTHWKINVQDTILS